MVAAMAGAASERKEGRENEGRFLFREPVRPLEHAQQDGAGVSRTLAGRRPPKQGHDASTALLDHVLQQGEDVLDDLLARDRPKEREKGADVQNAVVLEQKPFLQLALLLVVALDELQLAVADEVGLLVRVPRNLALQYLLGDLLSLVVEGVRLALERAQV